MTTELGTGEQSGTLPIPEELVEAAVLYAEVLDLDRSAVLLRWLRAGAEREMLKLLSDGEISTGKFVEVMGDYLLRRASPGSKARVRNRAYR